MMKTLLPDTLKTGQHLRTVTGHEVEVQKTSKRDAFGQSLYRLRSLKYGVLGHKLWSRDDLNEQEVELL